MPIITAPPTYIDIVNVPDGPQDTQDNLLWGPVARGGKLYSLATTSGSHHPVLYKSLDGGVTWTDITGVSPITVSSWRHVWDERGPVPNIITFMFVPAFPGPWNLVDFDIDTETWSAVYGTANGPPTTTTAHGGLVLARRSTGDVVLFGQANATTDSKFWVCAAGADWTVTAQPASFGGTSAGVLAACVNYADDRVCFIYAEGIVGGENIHYNSLDNTNTIGTPGLVKFVPDPIVPHTGRIYIDSAGKLRIGECSFGASTSPTMIGMLTGAAPLSAPTWSEVQVGDVAGFGAFFGVYFQYALEVGTTQWIIFAVSNQDPALAATRTWLYYSKLVSGSWTPIAIYYDSTANPPADWTLTPPIGPFLQSISASACPAATSPNVVVGMDSELGDGNTAYSFQLQSCSSSTSINVPAGNLLLTGFAPSVVGSILASCPLVTGGTVGVAYTSAVIATGGTAPFTYALISGALPPGLSLNAATGAITGIPTTAGSFTFVVRVTDVNGNTAVTPGCPIVISASASKCALQLTSDLNPTTVGQPVTLIAFIQPTTIAGIVSFFADGVLIGTGVLANGQASFTIAHLMPGTRVLTATFQGAPLPNCTACPLRQVITPALNVGTPCNPISMP